MQNQINQLGNASGKPAALQYLSRIIPSIYKSLLAPLLYRDASQTTRQKLLVQAGEYALLQVELDAHTAFLQEAALICQYGMLGTVPDDWYEEDEPYNAHQDLVRVLESTPGEGSGLSPRLVEFVKEVAQKSAKQSRLAMDTDSFANGMLGEEAGITKDEIDRESFAVEIDITLVTAPLHDYAEALATALALAKAGGDFEEISSLIN